MNELPEVPDLLALNQNQYWITFWQIFPVLSTKFSCGISKNRGNFSEPFPSEKFMEILMSTFKEISNYEL